MQADRLFSAALRAATFGAGARKTAHRLFAVFVTPILWGRMAAWAANTPTPQPWQPPCASFGQQTLRPSHFAYLPGVSPYFKWILH